MGRENPGDLSRLFVLCLASLCSPHLTKGHQFDYPAGLRLRAAFLEEMERQAPARGAKSLVTVRPHGRELRRLLENAHLENTAAGVQLLQLPGRTRIVPRHQAANGPVGGAAGGVLGWVGDRFRFVISRGNGLLREREAVVCYWRRLSPEVSFPEEGVERDPCRAREERVTVTSLRRSGSG